MIPQSERVERDALADLHAAASPAIGERLGLACERHGEWLVSRAGALPASAIVINRALGVGLDGAAARDDVTAMVRGYRDAGVARFLVQIHPACEPPDVARWLTGVGLEKTRGWKKFQRGVEAPPDATSTLSCRRVGPEHAAAFARIVCDAFDLGDGAVPWLSRLPGREHWHVFMSFDGDVPAGTGALYVSDDAGWLDFGATAPEHRMRGSQSALMAARIRFAAELGCRTLYTCTGEDVPGDPQHSYRNIVKAGFRESYLRANYAPPRD